MSVATSLNKNDGAKMAQRWCRGSKNSKYQKPCLGQKKMLLKNCKFILMTFFSKSICLTCGNVVPDGADWHHIAISKTNGCIKKSYLQEFSIF